MNYQVMPPLSAAEVDDLRESIREHGVLVPIIIAPNGEIVDGHHRRRLALELGVPCPTRHQNGTDAELRSIAYTANLARRHLSRDQRGYLVAESLRTDPDLSNAQHARRTGVSDHTVASIRTELEATSQIARLDARRSADGRERPAHIESKPDLVAQAVATYPELAHFRDTDQPKKAVEVARALDGYGDAERKMRRDNLAKFIAAEQRNGEPFKEPEPDPNYAATVAMFDAATSALIQINRIDGPAIVAAAAIHVESFEADNWRGQFQQAADTYQQLAQACGQRLRVIR